MKELTKREAECLARIQAYRQEFGYSPTSREVGHIMDVSQTYAHNLLLKLIEKGRIKKNPKKARSIQVL